MSKGAKWFALSLSLHLAAAITLFLLISRSVERTPKTIMVVLDNLAGNVFPLNKSSREPVLKTARSTGPVSLTEPEKPVVSHQLLQPVIPPVPLANTSSEQGRSIEKPRGIPDVSETASARQGVNAATSALAPRTKKSEHPAPGSEEPVILEKTQQRYMKEHFGYIRDLITTHLVYPPMARRMNWSGKVVLAFVIAEDGTVHAIRVVETSGFQILDKSAVETVRSVAPFPKPPVRAEITVPVNFRMIQ